MQSIPLFRYLIRYTIPFTGNIAGDTLVDYRVELLKRTLGNQPVEVVELDGGPQSFVYSLANDEDPLTPLRTSTAQISFADDIDLVTLLPSDGFEWQVRLVRVSDGVVLWSGYLTGEVFTQPYIDGVNIVTVNAVSPVVPALASQLPIADMSVITIGELFSGLILQSQTIKKIYIPAIFAPTAYPTIEEYTDILRMRFSTANYRRVASGDNVAVEEWDIDTFSAAVEAVCRLFAWSLVDTGDGALYLVAPAYAGRYMVLTADELVATDRFTPTTIFPDTLAESDIGAVDTDDIVEYRQGYGSATVEVKPAETKLEFADISAQIRGWEYERKQTTARYLTSSTGGSIDTPYIDYYAEVGKKIADLTSGQIVLPRYRSTVLADGSREWLEVTDGSQSDADVQLRYYETDSASADDIRGEDNQPAIKRSWSFVGFYRCPKLIRIGEDKHFLSDVPLEMLRTKSFIGIVGGGAICVNFQLRASYIDGFYMPEDYAFIGGNASQLIDGVLVDPDAVPDGSGDLRKDIFCSVFFGRKKYVNAYLRIGEWWWNGSAWTTEKDIFKIPIDCTTGEWHSVITNKTVDFPFAGEEGVFIELAPWLNGDLEFSLLSQLFDYEYPDDLPSLPNLPLGIDGNLYADIRGVTISYCPVLTHTSVSADVDGIKRKNFSRNFKDEKNITLTLHGSVNDSYQQSLVYVNDTEVLDTLYIGGVEEKKPEQHLLEECERLYARTMKRWRRGMPTASVRPIDVFDNGSAETLLMPEGVTTDYSSGKSAVYLAEVKKKSI